LHHTSQKIRTCPSTLGEILTFSRYAEMDLPTGKVGFSRNLTLCFNSANMDDYWGKQGQWLVSSLMVVK